MIGADEDEPENHLKLTPEEASALLRLRVDIPFIGGPECGKVDKKCKVFKPPFDRVFFINKQLAHYYQLRGNTDDGFHFHYIGVCPYRCLGNGVYEVKNEDLEK
jgi:hypothetical protein